MSKKYTVYITKNLDILKDIKIDLYYGGPVSNDYYYILKSDNDHYKSIKIDKNLYWGDDLEYLFNQIENGLIDLEDVIFLQGYSGWDLNQLDDEIRNKSWIIIDDTNLISEIIFDSKNKKSWNDIIKSLGGKYRIWSNAPDDITLN